MIMFAGLQFSLKGGGKNSREWYSALSRCGVGQGQLGARIWRGIRQESFFTGGQTAVTIADPPHGRGRNSGHLSSVTGLQLLEVGLVAKRTVSRFVGYYDGTRSKAKTRSRPPCRQRRGPPTISRLQAGHPNDQVLLRHEPEERGTDLLFPLDVRSRCLRWTAAQD